jgi:ABC-type bacteriocin/lantibiotic exporter with double-glycine peptidase domain
MDCGPAALKSLFESFGMAVSYGRLREACQTGIDGTSIDTMETVANQLGLQAEQVMLPADHVLLSSSKSLPAIAVVQLANGLTHFVVVWSVLAGWVQVMDPAIGRRWIRARQFLSELYQHTAAVSAEMWREFATSDEFQATLRRRLRNLGISSTQTEVLLKEAAADAGWRGLATLDAGCRLTSDLIESGAFRPSRNCEGFLRRVLQNPSLIPNRSWSTSPAAGDSPEEEQVSVRGAVLVRVSGRKGTVSKEELSEELAAAIEEKPARPWRELQAILRQNGTSRPALLVLALFAAAGGVLVEALLFRGLFDIASELNVAGQRLGAMAAVIGFGAILLLLDLSIFSGTARLGRHLELRFQVAFLSKIPKLGDRYFRSRLLSDMAERSHTTYRLRQLPGLCRQFLRSTFELCFTAAGIIWLEPSAATLVCLTAAAALIPSFLTQRLLTERDLRARSHAAALTRYYLDALLGLVAVRAHGAETGIRRGHERLLGEWASTMLRRQKAVVSAEALQLVLMFGLVAMLLMRGSSSGDMGRVLLLVYWALNLAVLGQEIGIILRQYPFYRNHTLRVLDPLGAPEESEARFEESWTASGGAPSIRFSSVSAQAGGQEILRDVNVEIVSGSHIAIVGQSGAGKSSLIGILLGWLKPAAGEVLVDGAPLDCHTLRAATAWVDPTVQIWNQSLLSNLSYGSRPDGPGIGRAVDTALLRGVLERLPEGMQTSLGEGGTLLSGGEAQRVRFARSMLRDNVRLIILDEPFRGLDRDTRRELLRRARQYWSHCTLLCITHDLEETKSFDRVLVVENGSVVEHGTPEDLLRSEQSRYACLMRAEASTRALLWSNRLWRRIHIARGRAIEEVSDHKHDRRTGIRVA